MGTPTIYSTSIFLHFVTCILNDTSSTAFTHHPALTVISRKDTDSGIERATIEKKIRLG